MDRCELVILNANREQMTLPKLAVLSPEFTIHRMHASHQIPASLLAEEFCWIGRTDEELSIVCNASIEIASDIRDDGWSCIKVLGPLDFSEVGILANISTVLAKASISIFALSTYDTDYILVKSEQVKKASSALTSSGYEIR